MRVLVACEFSGIVRDAFRELGHDAWSCDLLPSEKPGKHFKDDIQSVLWFGPKHWDLMIAFPPCTHLCVSGARWFADKQPEQQQAIGFFMQLANAPVHRIAIENPVGIMSSIWRKPDQIIQPWQFGHAETKATCLWLKNLLPLQPTHLEGDLFCEEARRERVARCHHEPPGPNRWKNRSRTFSGIAKAMAQQWANQPRHTKDCELGDNWKECPACLDLSPDIKRAKQVEKNV